MKTKEKDKKGIINALSMLWHFMSTKDKAQFVALSVLSIVPALVTIYTAMIPSILVAKFTGQSFLIFGFINLYNLGNGLFFFVTIGSIAIMWLLGMLVYLALDRFARKMMCTLNDRVEEVLLLERKNLDFGMTNGEANYIAKCAVDNIYYIIEPLCWTLIKSFFLVVFILVQVFLLNVIVGVALVGSMVLICLTIFLRVLFQKNVVKDIENSNAKIGNHFLMTLTNLPLITMFKSKNKEMKELDKLNSSYLRHNIKRANISFWYWIAMRIVKFSCLAGILVLYYFIANSTNLATDLVLICSLVIELYAYVEDWGFQISDIQSASIKLCNLSLLYPERKEIKRQAHTINQKVQNCHIKSIKVENYHVHLGNFEKTYSAHFQSGKVYVLSGQSGNGKTTLINAMCGLREIESGNLVINGKEIVPSLYEYRDKICYLFQESILFDRTIDDNLAYPQNELSPSTKTLIEKFDIQKLLRREQKNPSLSKTLSGGEKKRVEFIRTISKDKDIYFFDEPTNELDPDNVQKVVKEIKNLAQQDKIVIVISHDKRMIEKADKVLQL